MSQIFVDPDKPLKKQLAETTQEGQYLHRGREESYRY